MPTMLEGFAVPFHVTPIGRDRADHRVILVGTGSVSFHVTGTVSQMPMSLSGDQTVLRGTLGDGAVDATTPNTVTCIAPNGLSKTITLTLR